jgi:hypothetical protein
MSKQWQTKTQPLGIAARADPRLRLYLRTLTRHPDRGVGCACCWWHRGVWCCWWRQAGGGCYHCVVSLEILNAGPDLSRGPQLQRRPTQWCPVELHRKQCQNHHGVTKTSRLAYSVWSFGTICGSCADNQTSCNMYVHTARVFAKQHP